jgi:3-oxoacyl-[acyl-carrier protein] reductase
MDLQTHDRTALVFGGSRGIGAAIATTYVSRSGSGRSCKRDLQAAGAIAIRADSPDPAAIRRAGAETVDLIGQLDAAIINAGVLNQASIESATLEDLDLDGIFSTLP